MPLPPLLTLTLAALLTPAVSQNYSHPLTPNGIKAGVSSSAALALMSSHLGWWYDWTPVPSGSTGSPIAVSMLWGDGSADATDASRLAEFEAMTVTPDYILGFEEPDCSSGSGSSGINYTTAAKVWDEDIAPWAAKGSVLGSPSMCTQSSETWLGSCEPLISTPWDFTAIHINGISMAGAQKDLDHYWTKYAKPIWVSEFACVDTGTNGESWTPCTNQTVINEYTTNLVNLLESTTYVYAYSKSEGEGLGTVWPSTKDGALTASGQTYLSAISVYH